MSAQAEKRVKRAAAGRRKVWKWRPAIPIYQIMSIGCMDFDRAAKKVKTGR
jgi:hypothetical protein